MRIALWLLALFATAVAAALFAGSNQGSVTLFWPPYRVDLSLNLVIVLLIGAFGLLHLALRALAALLDMPQQAQRWRIQQKERGAITALLDASAHQLAGRFVRARKAAQLALARAQTLAQSGQPLPYADALSGLAQLVAAESAHALQDKASRDAHWQQLLSTAQGPEKPSPALQEVLDGAHLRAARWAMNERDPATALARLDAMPQGAQRRTLALRTRLKATQQAHQTQAALETTRLLAKHRAFSPEAAQTLVRGLVGELILNAHDPAQLQRLWSQLDPAERQMPELCIQAAQRLLQLGGPVRLARDWLKPALRQWLKPEGAPLLPRQRDKLVHALMAAHQPAAPPPTDDDASPTRPAHMPAPDREGLAQIEAAQQAQPNDAHLQYLVGMLCLQRQLWGKARQLLTQATTHLQDPGLQRSAWRALARLAEQRGDAPEAARAWRQAAQQD